ncbi:hypothetical protein D1638_13730 [Muribaculaceae bacterium Z1]|nr:hypothetical protein [Muribaculaceae bacterium Z1]
MSSIGTKLVDLAEVCKSGVMKGVRCEQVRLDVCLNDIYPDLSGIVPPYQRLYSLLLINLVT